MTAARTWHGRAFLGTSLDGFIAGKDGDLSFLESEPGKGQHRANHSTEVALEWETFFPAIDALVMGRTTYEKVLSFGEWPYPGLPVFVLSNSLPTADASGAADTSGEAPAVTVVRSVDEAVSALNSAGVQQVYIDGGRTVQAFLDAGAIDELTVSVLPIVIGEGTRLFDGVHPRSFAVVGSHVGLDGLVRTTYQVLN